MSKYKISLPFKALVRTIFFFYTKINKVTANIDKEIQNTNEPYLMLVNHVGFWDPFITGYFMNKAPHFVSSDAVFKDPVKRFFLKGLKTISKQKNVKDTKVIREIAEFVKNGEAIGLFPEATRTWTGNTLFIDDSIGKLIKLLNIPVITAKMKGMYLLNPRWALKSRKAKVEIDYKLIATKEDVKKLDSSDLTKLVRKNLSHNEFKYQQERKIKIKSNKRAEFLNFVIFHCPECGSFNGFGAKHNSLRCNKCNYLIDVDIYGNIQHKSEPKDLSTYFDIQLEKFSKHIYKKIKETPDQLLISDENMLFHKINEKNEVILIGKCRMELYADRLDIILADKTITFETDKISTLNPQLQERLELNYEDRQYRIIGEKPGVSGIRWEFAANIIWLLNNQEYKMSTYFKNDIKKAVEHK